MVGAIVVIIAIVVVLPVTIIVSGGGLAGFIGHVLRRDAEVRHEGSELIDLNG